MQIWHLDVSCNSDLRRDYLKITNHYLYEWSQVHKHTLTRIVADISQLIVTSINAKCLSQG